MEVKNQDEFTSSFSLVKFLVKYWKPIAIVCAATAVLSFLFSTPLFIKPKFQSTAIIYAPRTNSVAKILLNQENYNERLEVKAYGTEDETEQMMQILNTRELKEIIINKFNLAVHYDIDTNSKYWVTKLYKAFEHNCQIKRTQYGAISISVLDTDPQMAADIANEIVNQLDIVKNAIEHERSVAAYELLSRQLDSINCEIARLDDSLKVIMAHGVYDFESQSERVTQQHAIAIAQGNTAAAQRLETELEKLSTWGPLAVTIREHLLLFREYQVLCKSKMMDAKIDMDNQMPVKFKVQTAVAADKKAYPKKLTIVVISTLAAFVFSFIVLLCLERIKVIKKED
ncbi:MAG: Wzz/FepE/Etk N-terminal domain-containing protein [Bacteroidales bacterium]|nr:Wzz/FepE/Etk N-terminal domain-containing protein [Bacteroidales bacterium]